MCLQLPPNSHTQYCVLGFSISHVCVCEIYINTYRYRYIYIRGQRKRVCDRVWWSAQRYYYYYYIHVRYIVCCCCCCCFTFLRSYENRGRRHLYVNSWSVCIILYFLLCYSHSISLWLAGELTFFLAPSIHSSTTPISSSLRT